MKEVKAQAYDDEVLIAMTLREWYMLVNHLENLRSATARTLQSEEPEEFKDIAREDFKMAEVMLSILYKENK